MTKTNETMKKVWVLDDDSSICEAIKLVLDDSGYETNLLETGEELHTNLKSSVPDLIIMDILLTSEDGTVLSRNLKDNKKYKDIPIILMSANSLEENKLKESKAEVFLEKPFDIYELVDVLTSLLRKSN